MINELNLTEEEFKRYKELCKKSHAEKTDDEWQEYVYLRKKQGLRQIPDRHDTRKPMSLRDKWREDDRILKKLMRNK